jgi:HEAT repeat protein
VAEALGKLGAAGKPAVAALSRRLEGSNESVVFVLRSVAAALGDIGPPAASALPALEQTVKRHRVSYTAEEAIHKIKGEPVDLW